MLTLVKTALRVSTDSYDDEIKQVIAAALQDLGVAGVIGTTGQTEDALIRQAVLTYCKIHFGNGAQSSDRLQKSYDEQKAQLATHTGHTDWLEG